MLKINLTNQHENHELKENQRKTLNENSFKYLIQAILQEYYGRVGENKWVRKIILYVKNLQKSVGIGFFAHRFLPA